MPRETSDPKQFQTLVDEIAPGFTIAKVGKPGLAIVAEHAGRPGVLRTQCPSALEPMTMRRTIELPDGKRPRLVLAVSSTAEGSWQLKVNADGRNLHQQTVASDSAEPMWHTISVDLSALTGKSAKLELQQITLGGKPTVAYWGQVEILSD